MEQTAEKNKLFIGNLNRQTKWWELKEFFGQFGEVAYASVAFDREKRKAKGFGFVTFVNEDDAVKVKENNDNEQLELHGRPLFIEYARPREESDEQDHTPSSNKPSSIEDVADEMMDEEETTEE